MSLASTLAEAPDGVTDVAQGVIVVVQVLWLAALLFWLISSLRRFSRDRALRFLVGAVIAAVLIVATVFTFVMAALAGTLR